jgi:protein-tyrosine-phosphatase
MAEALLRRRLLDVGETPRVHSAGLRADGLQASRGAVDTLASRGLDLEAHRSRMMTEAMLAEADLVVGMAREHVQEAVVLLPSVWPRAFTLKELVRRAEQAGPRSPGQPFDEWLEKVHAGRSRSDLLGRAIADDVADPIGLGLDVYERTATEIAALVDRLVELGWRETGA